MQMRKCNPAFASKNIQRRMYSTKGIKADFVYVCGVEDGDEDDVPVIAMREGSPRLVQGFQRSLARLA
jgi:hypothetical protein